MIEVSEYQRGGWIVADSDERARFYCQRLEAGEILFFRQPPLEIPQPDREFLLSVETRNTRVHKNISYRPSRDLLRGFSGDPGTRTRLHDVMRRFSREALVFAASFLRPYGARWAVDYASFRPQEAEGRRMPLHKRDDLLHFDAFPSRPTRGGRILRIFININPTKPRVWNVADPFAKVAPRLAPAAGLEQIARGRRGLAAVTGWLHKRSPYDEFMLRFHDFLKENQPFQARENCVRVEFPPLSAWMTYTDGVPHAVLSGQYALEQTLIVRPEALVAPEQAPIRVLESLCGRRLDGSAAAVA